MALTQTIFKIFYIALLFTILIWLAFRDFFYTAIVFFSIFIGSIIILKLSNFINKKRYGKIGKDLKNILLVLDEYSTDRLLRDEREFETSIYEYLKVKLSNYKVKFQQKIKLGRVDIVINDNIAIELKIADSQGNLDSLFAQIEKYKEIFKDLILVILDLGSVNNIDWYKAKFEKKGATVVIKKDISVKRLNKKNR